MKYTDFFEDFQNDEAVTEYTGDTFSAPQPDLDTYGTHNPDPHPKAKKTMMEVLRLLEKSIPTSPEKWAKAKAAARAKFKVYPSAYANLWAAKKYKSMGGGWKKGKK